MNSEFLILVDENDQQWGKMEKLKVHQLGLLHRAFSIFIFNSEGKVLLQQRATNKYHSANLWSNTCCSHPHFGETLAQATKRRLQEEMGMDCPLTFAFKFIYKVDFSNGLSEYECDHVYFGYSDDLPQTNPLEVQSYKYVEIDELREDLSKNTENYTEWLKVCFDRLISHQEKRQKSA